MHIKHTLLILFIFLKLISCLLIFILFLLNAFVRVCTNACSFQFNKLCSILCLSLIFYCLIFFHPSVSLVLVPPCLVCLIPDSFPYLPSLQ